MSRLANVSGRDCVKALQRAGFTVIRQSGSHIILDKDGVTVSVPNHRPMKVGTVRSIIRQANLTVEEFLELL